MNSELKENKLEGTDTGRLKEYLNSERCMNAGVVLISENNNKVKLGAMNPIYEKVLDIVEELKLSFLQRLKLLKLLQKSGRNGQLKLVFLIPKIKINQVLIHQIQKKNLYQKKLKFKKRPRKIVNHFLKKLLKMNSHQN